LALATGPVQHGRDTGRTLNPPSPATKCSDQFHIEALNSHVAVITAPISIPRRLCTTRQGLSSIQDRHTDQSDPDGLASDDDDDVDRRKSTGLSTEHKRRNASRRSLFFLRLYVPVEEDALPLTTLLSEQQTRTREPPFLPYKMSRFCEQLQCTTIRVVTVQVTSAQLPTPSTFPCLQPCTSLGTIHHYTPLEPRNPVALISCSPHGLLSLTCCHPHGHARRCRDLKVPPKEIQLQC